MAKFIEGMEFRYRLHSGDFGWTRENEWSGWATLNSKVEFAGARNDLEFRVKKGYASPKVKPFEPGYFREDKRGWSGVEWFDVDPGQEYIRVTIIDDLEEN